MYIHQKCDGFCHVIKAKCDKINRKRDKNINGMRDASRTPLTESEIQYIKSEIKRIQAD